MPSPPAILEGIDVSSYQGAIDWPRVRAAGKAFVIVRASDGLHHLDVNFTKNWQGAQAAGLDVGAYQFFRPSQDPIEQARALLAMMPSDATIDPTVDVETLDGMSPNEVAARVGAWIDYVAAELPYSTPIVYTSPAFWAALPHSDNYSDNSSKTALWIAHWGVQKPIIPHGWDDWTYWQYDAKGHIDGITGPVDLDRFQLDVAADTEPSPHRPGDAA